MLLSLTVAEIVPSDKPVIAIDDAQKDYSGGIIIIKKSVLLDEDAVPIVSNPTTSSSSGGGGGGGGGGVTSAETVDNILQFEQHEGNIIKDKPTSYKFNLSIYEVLITGKENEYDVSVRVELLKNHSKAAVKPDGEVLTYFNIITSTKRMKEAAIRFKINQTAKLVKWNGSDWIELNITYDNNYYQATVNSLSSFAIIKVPKAEILTLASATPQPASIEKTTSLLYEQTPQPKQAPGFGIFITLISLILLVVICRKK
jgi:PGF-pre-PGF domain-containing protein